jgi:hypothetical protein
MTWFFSVNVPDEIFCMFTQKDPGHDLDWMADAAVGFSGQADLFGP